MDSDFVGLDTYRIFFGGGSSLRKKIFFFANFTKAYNYVNIFLETLPGKNEG